VTHLRARFDLLVRCLIAAAVLAWLFRDPVMIRLATPDTGTSHFTLLLRIIGKLGHIAFPLLLALGVVFGLAARESSRRLRIGCAAGFLLAWLIAVTFGPRLGNLGFDSIREVASANSQEAMDFIRTFVLAPGYTLRDMVLSVVPALLLGLLVILMPHRAGELQPVRQAALVAGLLLLPAVQTTYAYASQQFLDREVSERLLRKADVLGGSVVHAHEPVDVILMLGESTAVLHQSLLGYHRDTNAPLRRFGDDLLVFTDVVAPHSFTRESLLRMLSVADDPLLDQLTPDDALNRANLVRFLRQAGIGTHWLSNQSRAGAWDYGSQLFGREAEVSRFLNFEVGKTVSADRHLDEELLPLLAQALQTATARANLFVLHTYAGHHDYCMNIPRSAVHAFDDTVSRQSWAALFGQLRRNDRDIHIADIDCYDNAVRYVSENLAKVIDLAQRSTRPVVVIYVSDHGEDPLGGTYHDAAVTRLSHLSVPLYVFANATARQRRPALIGNARFNRDVPYSTSWLSDTLLDAFGFELKGRELQSLFRRDMPRLPRYSLLRTELLRGTTFVSVDLATTSPLDRSDGALRFARELRAQPLESARKLCVHRADSLYKFLLASSISPCVEVDIVVPADRDGALVYHPPARATGLTLDDLLAIRGARLRRVWLDVKTSDTGSLLRLCRHLKSVIERHPDLQLMVEVEVGANLSPEQVQGLQAIRQIRDIPVLFYIPYAYAKSCKSIDQAEQCRADLQGLDRAIDSGVFTGISFDMSLLSFARQLNHYPRLDKHVWGTPYPDPASAEFATIILPVPTDFDY